MGDTGDHIAKLLDETRASTYLGRALNAGHRPSFTREPAVEYLFAVAVTLERVCVALAEELDAVRHYIDRVEHEHSSSLE